jgi:hypothetical protein
MHRDDRYGSCRSLSPPFASRLIIGDVARAVSLGWETHADSQLSTNGAKCRSLGQRPRIGAVMNGER